MADHLKLVLSKPRAHENQNTPSTIVLLNGRNITASVSQIQIVHRRHLVGEGETPPPHDLVMIDGKAYPVILEDIAGSGVGVLPGGVMLRAETPAYQATPDGGRLW